MDIKISGEVQIDETLWCHKVNRMFYDDQPYVYGRQQWIFGARKEIK